MPEDASRPQLDQLIELFARHGIEYVIVGGQAEALFGSPRVTYDTDICHRLSPENLARMAAALRELDARVRFAPPELPFRLDAQSLALGVNYVFSTNLGDLDLISWVEPIGDDDELIQRAERIPYRGHELKVIALEDLIRVKEHIARKKDSESLYQLRAIKRLRE